MNRLTRHGKKNKDWVLLNKICSKANGNFCPHAETCNFVDNRTCPYLEALDKLAAYEDAGLTPEEVKDAILLPCKIGDKAWAIRSYGRHQRAVEGVVSEMYFLGHRGEDMRLVVVVKNVARGLYGKAVFATRAEAEEALKGDIK